MSTSKKLNKTTRAALATSLATGAGLHFPAGAQIPVSGVTLTIPAIQAKLTAFAKRRGDVETARANLTAKIAAEDAETPGMDAFVADFVKIVRGSFSTQPDVLQDFGVKPETQRTPLTVQQKTAAAAKREATRAARGTKGPKAKQAIHGDVTGVVVTPVTAAHPATAQPAAAPAPATTTPTKS
jgi:hypothetical protein